MKKYFTFPKIPVLHPHHQMQFRVIYRTLIRGGSYHSADVQSTYSTAPVNRASLDKSFTYLSWAIFQNDVNIFIVFKVAMEFDNMSVFEILV